MQIIVRHGQPAERLCNKDPFTLKSVAYLRQLFPRSKFILMLRDGRATVHSIISRKVTITGFDLKNPKQCLEVSGNLEITNCVFLNQFNKFHEKSSLKKKFFCCKIR
jgi:hypothetical protein